MKSSEIKVLNVKNKYNFSGSENEILTKQAVNLERNPSMYNNYHNINNANSFNDNSFFLDDYEIIGLSINSDESRDSFQNKSIDNSAFVNNKLKIANPTKLAKVVQKQPIFPLKNENDFYVSANTLMQNNTKQVNCTNCLMHLSTTSSLSLFNKTGNNKYDKKIVKINAKTNYYLAKYEQMRVKKQLQIDWKCCSKHISSSCHFTHQNKNDLQATQINNLTDFDQQHNKLMLKSSQNEMLDTKSVLLNVNNTGKEDFNFDDLPQQNTEESNFIIDEELDLSTNPNGSDKKQNVSNPLVKNNEQSKDNKLRINFVETNPNEKRKIKPKHKFEENSVDKSQTQVNKNESETDFDFFADFNNSNDSFLDEKQQPILNYDKKAKLQKPKNQNKKNINFSSDIVITWNSFLNISLKIILFATIALAICLGIFFKQQINNSKTHWNILWLLNKNSNIQKSGWLNFVYNNTFLLAGLLYTIAFILPLIIFNRKKMFIISLTLFMIGLVSWTIFACLGFFKYSTFKVNKMIAALETSSLIASWLVFTLFLSKLVKYYKQGKKIAG